MLRAMHEVGDDAVPAPPVSSVGAASESGRTTPSVRSVEPLRDGQHQQRQPQPHRTEALETISRLEKRFTAPIEGGHLTQ
ncbi:hypothetical protein STCU_10741 [Strigomonas culicis]|uniref:Uncharacterized protein n=1 Tax=Strigomonas culicis TaxID=28005 RepID=S9TLJ6_9TRYP|nr:hypothetical protein STCU_10741 [Strigomonas culicis]|eukprot:EPY17233.1 hypothetical protein STCU_10741 [Strigomonas culicis]